MKLTRLALCALPLVLTGCSSLSSVRWSAAYPWNWFGSSIVVTEQGVGNLTASTPLTKDAISDALESDYQLRSGMKIVNGSVVKYFEALKDGQVALTIDGESNRIKRIDVMDKAIPTATGTTIGTPFRDIYSKAYNNCQKGLDGNAGEVECRIKGSQHVSYIFAGRWNGPPELMPSDDTLKEWKISKIVWRR